MWRDCAPQKSAIDGSDRSHTRGCYALAYDGVHAQRVSTAGGIVTSDATPGSSCDAGFSATIGRRRYESSHDKAIKSDCDASLSSAAPGRRVQLNARCTLSLMVVNLRCVPILHGRRMFCRASNACAALAPRCLTALHRARPPMHRTADLQATLACALIQGAAARPAAADTRSMTRRREATSAHIIVRVIVDFLL